MQSTDNGTSWQTIANVKFGDPISAMVSDNEFIYAGTSGNGVVRTSDNGVSWNGASLNLYTVNVTSLAVGDGNLFAATTGGVYRSSDHGGEWTTIMNMFPDPENALAFANGRLYVGTTTHGVYISTDDGASWIASSADIEKRIIYSLVANGGFIFAGTDSGVYVSSDEGTQWIARNSGLPASGNSNSVVNTFIMDGNKVFAASRQGIFLSSDSGINWIDANGTELTGYYVNALAVDAYYIYAGTETSIWRRPLSDFGISAVDEKPDDLPAQVYLSQNYPNPFSGVTNVEYRIPNAEHVTLNVYDMLGREVATLAQGMMSAGTHSVQLSGDGLQNGIYFYRLMAGKNVQTGKMTVVK